MIFINPFTKAAEPRLKEFETDNCTMFADGTPQKPELWKHCCFEHDLRYWFGGDNADIDFADEQLRLCVLDVATPFWANLIYRGVREGHKSPVQHRLHWSWGWTEERALAPLTAPEKEIIRNDLDELNLDRHYIETFILKYNLN